MDERHARAYLGVGSNIQPEDHVRGALQALAEHPDVTVTKISTFYRTAPLSDPNSSHLPPDSDPVETDPDFLNGVLEIRTRLSPDELLDLLAEIERASGRVRPANPYAPRTLDLDLLLYGLGHSGVSGPTWSEIGPTGYLAHSDIGRRAFVALPLLELAPDLSLPPHGIPLKAYAAVFESPGGLPEEAFTTDLRARFLHP